MPSFKGFSAGKARLTPLPGQFFSELLPEIDHLGELKVTLYVFWRLDRTEGSFRYIRRSDFLADPRFMEGLGKSLREAEAALDDALERAAGRGTLLRADIQTGPEEQTLYFLNSPKGRAAVEAIQAGSWHPTGDSQAPVELRMERPNIFRLYEENFGPLTPLIADSLRDAADSYPDFWIEDAIRIAVENNIRRWRYVEAILRSWKEEGRDEQNRGDSEEDRRRYFKRKYAESSEP